LFKQYLEEFLTPLGRVQRNREIPGEPAFIDLWFEPTAAPEIQPDQLGLLGRLTHTASVIEPYHRPPNLDELRSCLFKLLHIQAEAQRQAHRDDRALTEAELPRLWILTPTLSSAMLNSVAAQSVSHWPQGVYFLADALHSGIIVIHHLPPTPDTLWLRLLGQGRVQQQAITEVLALTPDDGRRLRALRVLSSWKVAIELTPDVDMGIPVDRDDEEVMMALTQAYLEWERATEQRGLEQGLEQGLERGQKQEASRLVLRLLTHRFGTVPETVEAEIKTLSVERLEDLGESLLDFTQFDDVVEWLAKQRSLLPSQQGSP
jgi:hypothetical protein